MTPPPGADSEIRINCATFAFVTANRAWYYDGVKELAGGVESGKIKFALPPDSILIKAKWHKVKPGDNLRRYHVGTNVDGQWKLVGLHLTSKLVPNWLWATWEHVDNERRPVSSDTFGFPRATGGPSDALAALFYRNGLATEWWYYRLNGTQTEYTNTMGRANILGNSEIEGKLAANSSCITCHAHATESPRHGPVPEPATLGSPVGTPKEEVFQIGTFGPGPSIVQLDFLWVLALEPKNHYQPPTVDTDCRNYQ